MKKLFVRDKQFYKMFFTMAMTISLQNVIVCAVNLADNVMIGGYSELSLSAVSVVNQIQFLVQMIAMGFANGLIVLTAQYWGKKELTPIKRCFGVTLAIGMAFVLILFGAVLFFPRASLSLLTDQTAVVNEGIPYLLITCFSYPFFLITQLLLALMRSIEKVRIGFVVSLSALVSNVFLNYILIYGHLGFSPLGIRGAAIATLISRLIEFAVVLIYVFAVEKTLRLKLRHFFYLEKSFVRLFFKVGFPLTLSSLSWGIAMAVQGVILGHLGSESVLSANSIATTVFQLISVVLYAAGSAASVIIGKTIGENKLDLVKQYAKTLQVLFLLIGLASGAVLFFSRPLFLLFYKQVSAPTKALANLFMTILCVTTVGTAYECPCLTGIVCAGGETNFVFRNDLIFMWGIVLPLSLLSAFVFHWPPAVTFAFLKSDQVTKCAVAAVKVNRFRWIRDITMQSNEDKTEEIA
ncbi:MAG TPA: MATE family efflux transporter [Ruminococcaceae bacterium]|nr:MATE family efflux transporter [Oscillospiraceae bacterium]